MKIVSSLLGIEAMRQFNEIHTGSSSSTEDSSSSITSKTKKKKRRKKRLIWVTRYSLGKTLSKELLIEHEFADDENRHRLIEIHKPADSERKHYVLLAMVALLLNPPIGVIACSLALVAHRRSHEAFGNYESPAHDRMAIRCAFISYMLSILSIGLTIGLISSVLLYFFVRDLKIVRQDAVKHRYEEGDRLSSSSVVNDVITSRTPPSQQNDDNLLDHDDSGEEPSMAETEMPL